MARYGYGNSVCGSRTAVVASSGGAAPSGIPTATTTIVNISIVSSGFNDNFVKSYPNTWYSAELAFEFQYGQWYVRDAESSVYTINTLPSQTENYIPLTGWSPSDTTITVVA
jgi:hypothetical protein